MPRFLEAAAFAAQSTTADPSEQDIKRALHLPERLAPDYSDSGREQGNYSTLGMDYSFIRCREHWVVGNRARAVGWATTGVLGFSAAPTSLLTIPILAGLICAIKHGSSYPRRPYSHRTSEGLREDMMLYAMRRLRPQVMHLVAHSSDHALSAEELLTCYAHVAGVLTGLNAFVARHPHARLRGSTVLKQELELLSQDTKALRRAAGIGRDYVVPINVIDDLPPTLRDGPLPWMVAKGVPNACAA